MKKKISLVILAALLVFFTGGFKESYAALEEILGTFETPLLNKSPNRTNNIKLAAQQLQQVVLQPGEVFSFNKVVGERTKERGFKVASVFENGKIIQGIGGGICQLSSTLYQAVLNAKLKVIEVNHHSLKVDYIAPGKDATVSWGFKDFKFLNNTDSPLRISAEVTDKSVRTTIYKLVKEKPVKILYNGNLLETNPEAFVAQSVTYVPLRLLSEQMSCVINWDGVTKQITILSGDATINLKPNSLEATVNGEVKILSSPPLVKNGVTFVPLRFLAEHFGLNLDWTGDSVHIQKATLKTT